MKKRFVHFSLLFLLILMGTKSYAQKPKLTRILFILDCSLSMNDELDGKRKMDVAKHLLVTMVDSLKNIPNVDQAIRAYGHRSPTSKQDCRDTRLEVGFEVDNTAKIINVIKKLQPKGTTPIAYSLGQAAYDFPDSKAQNIIILITDGGEECKGEPCKVSQELQNKNVILKPFIIGIGLTPEIIKTYDCVGRFYNTSTEQDLNEILRVVISQALDNTTAQLNLLNAKKSPAETDVAFQLSNSKSQETKYLMEHFLIAPQKPDTFKIDPTQKYDLTIYTLPQISKKGLSANASRHNIFTQDAMQGTISISMKTSGFSSPPPAVVRSHGIGNILNIQDLNTTEKYLNGTYDTEILTLPRVISTRQEVDEKSPLKMDIPYWGYMELNSQKDFSGAVFIEKDNRINWVINIDGHSGKETINLQPGSYTFIYHLNSSNETTETLQKNIKIQSGSISAFYIK